MDGYAYIDDADATASQELRGTASSIRVLAVWQYSALTSQPMPLRLPSIAAAVKVVPEPKQISPTHEVSSVHVCRQSKARLRAILAG
jgi:hypothetical protein